MELYFKPGMILAGALTLGLLPFSVQADDHDKKTVITVDEPIQVADTYLEPGTYVFKLIESSSDRHTVEIYNKNESHLIKLMFAVPNYRLRPPSTNHSQFTFWETPPGTAKAVRAWFYPGDNYGHEFPYPSDLKQLSTATTTTAAAPAPQPLATVTESEKSEAVTPAPQPALQQALEQEPSRQQQEPVQIAQNTPAPESQPQAQAPAPQPANDTKEPEELPQTASPYPLIGLAGLLSAGLFVLLRIKRLS